jgi:hypothetical protein
LSGTEDPSGDSEPPETQPHLNRLDAEDPADGEDAKYIRAVRAKITPAVEENPSRSALNRKLDRPKRSKRQETCLAGWIKINGVDALTLFDSGSNTDTLSPSFTQISGISTRKLENQVPLQLGTVGSRAAINYGAQVPIEIGDKRIPDYYFDIVNIDRYDCIHWGQGVVFWSRTWQVHCKEMDDVPGKNQPSTLQTHSQFSKPISLQCSGTENAQYIHSVPVMFPLGKPWVHSEFSQRM